MKRNRTITKSLGDTTDDRTDWTRLEHMTEEELHRAAEDDPDAPPTTSEDWEETVVIQPGGRPGVQGPKPSSIRNIEIKVRFGSLREKEQVLDFIRKRYPELSINAFFRQAAREKIEREE